jgi:cell division protein FtsI/penicillin-binding protein 2
VVVLDASTAQVLVYASHGGPGDLVRAADPPAASVFKIVTSSALLAAGLGEGEVTCYSGGFHAITVRDLVQDPRRDRDCVPLAGAFARSINTVFARRALERLHPEDEIAQARQWGFGETVPFDAEVAPSDFAIPGATLAFARTVAGFWNSHLSPLHGALLAQGIAQGGEMLRPWMLESVRNAQGELVAQGGVHAWRRAVSPEVAASLGRFMLATVSEGTARHAFHDPAGTPYLDGVTVGGKTGTLTADAPYRAYTWFVGNAEGHGRRLSFAVMVANGPLWRVKAATLARQVLQIAYRGRATD